MHLSTIVFVTLFTICFFYPPFFFRDNKGQKTIFLRLHPLQKISLICIYSLVFLGLLKSLADEKWVEFSLIFLFSISLLKVIPFKYLYTFYIIDTDENKISINSFFESRIISLKDISDLKINGLWEMCFSDKSGRLLLKISYFLPRAFSFLKYLVERFPSLLSNKTLYRYYKISKYFRMNISRRNGQDG
jgi:hypothetical protein